MDACQRQQSFGLPSRILALVYLRTEAKNNVSWIRLRCKNQVQEGECDMQ